MGLQRPKLVRNRDCHLIKYRSSDSFKLCFEFYKTKFKRTKKYKNNIIMLKIGKDGWTPFRVKLRKGERVVRIQANKDGNCYYNVQLIIMGPG